MPLLPSNRPVSTLHAAIAAGSVAALLGGTNGPWVAGVYIPYGQDPAAPPAPQTVGGVTYTGWPLVRMHVGPDGGAAGRGRPRGFGVAGGGAAGGGGGGGGGAERGPLDRMIADMLVLAARPVYAGGGTQIAAGVTRAGCTDHLDGIGFRILAPARGDALVVPAVFLGMRGNDDGELLLRVRRVMADPGGLEGDGGLWRLEVSA